jgi:hypothetical protein
MAVDRFEEKFNLGVSPHGYFILALIFLGIYALILVAIFMNAVSISGWFCKEESLIELNGNIENLIIVGLQLLGIYIGAGTVASIASTLFYDVPHALGRADVHELSKIPEDLIYPSIRTVIALGLIFKPKKLAKALRGKQVQDSGPIA